MDSRSFTLLEVIAAVSLMAIAVAGIAQGQSGSVRNVIQSEKLSQAYFLAQAKMTETEIDVQKKGFLAFLEEEKGEFEDEKQKEFRWVRRMEQVDLGCFIPEADNDNPNQPLHLTIAKDFFQQAVRKIVIEVEWDEGSQTRFASLAQLFVNYRDVPNVQIPGTN